MIGSDFKDLFVLFLVFGGGFWVLAPLARAFAKRISATAPPLGQARVLDELREELRQVRQEVAELAERVDFTERALDRKSTRLNSSHSQISYAVFCLKKKKTQ